MGTLDDLATLWAESKLTEKNGPDWKQKMRQGEANIAQTEANTALLTGRTGKLDQEDPRIAVARLNALAKATKDPIELAKIQAQINLLNKQAGKVEAQTEDPSRFFKPTAPPQPSYMPATLPDGTPGFVNRRNPADVFTGGAKPALPPGIQQDLTTLGQVKDAAAGMEQSYPDVGSFEQGPFFGSLSRIGRKIFGNANPAGDFDYFANRAEQIIYALSGKQINEVERRTLKELIPDLSHPSASTPRDIQRFNDYIDFLVQAKGHGGAPPPGAAPHRAPAPGAPAGKIPIGARKTFTSGPSAGKTGVWNGSSYDIQ